MENKLYGTKFYIDLSILESNLKFFKKKIGESNFIAIVKANAYGFGDVTIANKLQDLGVKNFGVADFDEGINLKKNGIKGSIMVMNPGINNIEVILKNHLEPVVYNKEILLKILDSRFKSIHEKNIHIKINSGMNRWGFDLNEVDFVINKIKNKKDIKVKSVYSHLSSPDNLKDQQFTKKQHEIFKTVKTKFKKYFSTQTKYHILSSSSIKNYPKIINNSQIRIGILMYGSKKIKSLRPVGELKCTLSHIRKIKRGQSIGYKRSFIAPRDMIVGIIPMGYADGLQRSWGNGLLKFIFKGQYLPTVGIISMDSSIVDLSEVNNISTGDEVTYFGQERNLWDLADELDTIPYEITSILSKRIKRVYF
tara:strand:+ start:143 stop:1237 length:1095 start_codon:yes stop_codon:yes gene_type:complete